MLTYLSVCSGIEAASVAWRPLGWKAAAFSEIEPFPSAVLAHHYPEVPNLGDMTRFQEWPDLDPDVLVGGTPCQSFSVAGLRRGLDDPRGELMLVYGAIARRYRPRWLVWENVPGVLSSNGGRDFGAFLGMLAELGYGFAYRVLDAQFFGVAQRRRRVFVVGHLGDWRRAAAVLFDAESMRGNPAPSREAGEGVAVGTPRRTDGGSDVDHARAAQLVVGGGPDGGRIAGAVTSKWSKGSGGPAGDECQNMVAHALRGEGFDASEDGTGRGTPLVPVSFTGGASECITLENCAHPVTCRNGDAGMIAFDTTQITSLANRSSPKAGDPCHPLDAGAHPPAVAFAHKAGGTQTTLGYDPETKTAPTLASNQTPPVHSGLAVRRLTARECERLQGFQWRCTPDTPGAWQDGAGRYWSPDYTLIPTKTARQIEADYYAYLRATDPSLSEEDARRLAADGPRYKALGNSMAVPVMAWIGRRIAEVDAIERPSAEQAWRQIA